VLLFGASLFTQSLRKLKVVNLGYDIDHVLSVEIGNRGILSILNKPAATNPALADLLARVRQLPDVESAAFSNPGVLAGSMMWGDITVAEGARHISDVSFLIVSPGYLATMHIPLFRGRDFAATDRKSAPLVAIINQRLASQISPGQNTVGMHFDGWSEKNIEIVGVVGNSKYQNVREDMKPIVFLSFDQEAPGSGTLEVRCRNSVSQVEREVRQVVKSAAPGYEVSNATAMELMRDNLISQDRLLTFLSSLFGALGTTLALVGIYGLISYSVTRRTREIGIRMSIGAQRSDVLWLFLREATLLVIGGMLLGLPLALILAGFLRKMLFEVSTTDPLGISATLVLLLLGGLIASFVPARRATRVNPVQALRYD
jgi:predicted permease